MAALLESTDPQSFSELPPDSNTAAIAESEELRPMGQLPVNGILTTRPATVAEAPELSAVPWPVTPPASPIETRMEPVGSTPQLGTASKHQSRARRPPGSP